MQSLILFLLVLNIVFTIYIYFLVIGKIGIDRNQSLRRVSENQKKALEYLKKHRKITNKKYQDLVKVGRVKSFKDLDNLEKRGLIRQLGKTGKSVFYELI